MLDLESRFEQLVEEKAGIHDLREFVRQLVRELDGFRNEIKEEVTVRSRSASLDMTKTLAAEVCAEHTKEIEDLKSKCEACLVAEDRDIIFMFIVLICSYS